MEEGLQPGVAVGIDQHAAAVANYALVGVVDHQQDVAEVVYSLPLEDPVDRRIEASVVVQVDDPSAEVVVGDCHKMDDSVGDVDGTHLDEEVVHHASSVQVVEG